MSLLSRSPLATLALAAGLGLAAPAAIAQVNPTASAVQEQQLLEALQQGQAVTGRVSIPDQRAANLIKPAGQDWRTTHQVTLWWVTVLAVAGMLALVTLFYLTRGRIRVESGLSGVKILRFNAVERFTHWMTASCFIVLALTGLNLVIGKHTLLPLLGPEAFTAVTAAGKLAHNYLAWPFMLGVALMFLIWVKDNIPGRVDAHWIAAGGGFGRDGGHPPARRFNAGQKLIFWAVVLGGAALSVTGVLLLFPALAGDYANWQLAQVVHGVVSAVLIAVMIAHIYIGSLGMEGAFDAMGSGEVDLSWAREHHSLWVEEVRAAGRAAPGRGVATPAE